MDSDTTNSYPSAMWDEKAICPKIETGYVFKPDRSYEVVKKFETQTFTQGSAILKVLISNPSDSIF